MPTDILRPGATDAMLARAEHFMWHSARIIDRLRFEYHFRNGRREPILHALGAYRTEDGGFGHALEPDGRGPGAQPLSVWTALELLIEADLAADPAASDVVRGACDWLSTVTLPDGGVPFVLPSIASVPHAPWLEPERSQRSSLLMTGLMAGTLRTLGVDSPWVERATEFCFAAIDRLEDPHPYEARSGLTFLDTAPDRRRAERAFERLGRLVRERRLVTLEIDHDVPGEAHTPLDFAPFPDTTARRLFDDRTIERHLDALVSAQQADGGWPVDWTIWTPITEPEWRGIQTVRRLRTLRAYGRLPAGRRRS